MFETLNNAADKGAESGKKYIESSYKHAKLKIFQQLTVSVGMVAKIVLIGGLISTGLIFLAVAAAIAIGHHLDNVMLGYLIVGGLFFVLALIIFALKKSIEKVIIVKISKKFFD